RDHRPLCILQCLPGVREGRRRLACDFTAKDVNAVRDGGDNQLLRRPSKIDHSIELRSALPTTPHAAQHGAVENGAPEAGAEPESINAELEISLSEPKTLLRNGEALREPRGPKKADAEAVPNSHSQGLVLRCIC